MRTLLSGGLDVGGRVLLPDVRPFIQPRRRRRSQGITIVREAPRAPPLKVTIIKPEDVVRLEPSTYKVYGHIPYNTPGQNGYLFLSGAFRITTDWDEPVDLVVGHKGAVVARTTDQTLTLHERDTGLWFEAQLSSKHVFNRIKRRELNGLSPGGRARRHCMKHKDFLLHEIALLPRSECRLPAAWVVPAKTRAVLVMRMRPFGGEA